MVRRFWNQTCPRRHRHHHGHGHRAGPLPPRCPASPHPRRAAATPPPFGQLSPQGKRPSPAAPRSRLPPTPGCEPAAIPSSLGARAFPAIVHTHLGPVPSPAPLPSQMYLLSGRALPEEGGIFIVEAAIIYSQPPGCICSDKRDSADQTESVSTAEGPLWPSPPSKRLCTFSGSSARSPNPSHLRFAQSPEFLTKT